MKLILYKTFLLVSFLGFPFLTFTQTIEYEFLTIKNGLTQNAVFSSFQDSKGYLWFGTSDGLNRYNGYDIEPLTHDVFNQNSLSPGTILSITETPDGFIWAGSEGSGLNRIDPKNFNVKRILFDPAKTNLSNRINQLKVDHKGRLIVGTSQGLGIYSPENDSVFYPDVNQHLDSKTINVLFIDRKHRIWLGFYDGTIIMLNDSYQIVFKNKPAPSHAPDFNFVNNLVTSFAENSLGTIYFSRAKSDIYQYNEINNTIELLDISIDNYNPEFGINISMMIDTYDYLWLGMGNYTVFRIHLEKKEIFSFTPRNTELARNQNTNINSIMQSKDGVLWLSTIGRGVARIKSSESFFQTIQPFGTKVTISNSSLRAITQDRNGNFWFSGYTGIDILDSTLSKKITSFTLRDLEKFGINAIGYAMINDPEDKHILWVGTEGSGVFRININTFEHKHYSTINRSFNPNFITSMQLYSKDELILGTSNGLILFNRKTTKSKLLWSYNTEEVGRLLPGMVTSIYIQPEDSTLWIGTYNAGLFHMKKNADIIQRFTYSSSDLISLSSNKIKTIYRDSKHRLWIGTGDAGLNLYQPESKTIKVYSTQNGLPNNVIYGILEDHAGYLWMSTNQGISQFHPETEKFRNFNVLDGLQSNEFNTASFFKNKKGVLFFGGIEGVNYFEPIKFSENKFIVHPVLFNSKVLGTYRHSDERTPLIIHPSEQEFSFEIGAFDYRNPIKIHYQYRLSNFDTEWINAGNRRYISYTNVDPGTYHFQVKATNSDGIWQEHYLEIPVIVLPPFYRTWWFYTISIIFFVSIWPLLFYRRLLKAKRETILQRKINMELIRREEEERKRIANELHDSVGQDMLVIKNKLLALQRMSDKESLIGIELQKVTEITHNALHGVREISHNLRPHQLDQLGLTKAIQSMIRKVEESTDLNIDVVLPHLDPYFPKTLTINVYRMLQECLNNVIKHSQASHVWITVTDLPLHIQMVVEDNGIGFITGSERNLEQNAGFGMTGLMERARILNGDIHIESVPGKGTKIVITIEKLQRGKTV